MKTIARALIAAVLCQPILPTLTARGATRTSRAVYAYKGSTRFTGRAIRVNRADRVEWAQFDGRHFSQYRRVGRPGRITSEWRFRFQVDYLRLPRYIRPGDQIVIRVTGWAQRVRGGGYVNSTVGLRSKGFRVTSCPKDHRGGNCRAVTVGHTSSGYYSHFTRTFTLTALGGGELSLDVVGPHGTCIGLVWRQK